MEVAGQMSQMADAKLNLKQVRLAGARNDAQYIGELAYQALLEEVYTTPKPGLVDLATNGAHSDMDVHTFERSALALQPWFRRIWNPC